MRRAALCLLLLLGLALPAAADGELIDTDAVASAVSEEARQILENADPADPDPEGTLARMLNFVREHLWGTVKEVLGPLASIVGICLMCSAAEALLPEGGGAELARFGGCLGIAAVGLADVGSVLRLGIDTLAALTDFSRVLLPTLTTAAVVSGAPGAATAAYAASALFSDLLLSAAEGLLLPLICGYAAAAVCTAVLDSSGTEGAAKFLHWCAGLLLKGLVIGFTAYLSLTGILAGAADAAAVKAAKTVISTALPVVGKLMAEASEALVAGAGLLRSAVGVYGMLACLATVLLPVLRLGLRCLLFRAAAALSSGFAGARQAKLISALSGAYGMLLSLVGCGAAMQFLSIISFIRTVTV